MNRSSRRGMLIKVNRKMASLLKKNKILAIELAGNALRAVVVKRQGRSIAILAGAEIHIHAPPDAAVNQEDIRRLLEQLRRYPKRVVLLSRDVKFLTSELPIPPDVKVSSEKMQEAVRWEADPYLDFPVSEGLYGYEQPLQSRAQSADRRFTGEAVGKTTPVLISAVSKDYYRRWKYICKNLNLVLSRVYAQECAFAFSVARSSEGTANKIVLNLQGNLVTGALLKRGFPLIFHSTPLEAVETLLSKLAADAEQAGEVIITGDEEEAAKKIANRLKGQFQLSIRMWKPENDIENCLTPTSPTIGPRFAGLVGAALQELKITAGNRLGITDQIALSKRLKATFHILPLAMVGTVALGFLCHYLLMLSSSWHFSRTIERLTVQKKKLLGNMSYLTQLRTETRDLNRQRRYIEQVLPAQHADLVSFLDCISKGIPFDVVLHRIVYDTFLLQGESLSVASVTAFVRNLERLAALREATHESTITKPGGLNGNDKDSFVYEFQIRAILR